MQKSLTGIRSQIETLGMNFKFIKTIKTNMNKIERETWLLEYEGSQFVFVEGQKNVTLGWDTAKCSLGKETLDVLRSEFNAGFEYYKEEIAYLNEYYQKEIAKANANNDSTKAEKLASELSEELGYYEEEMAEGYTDWGNFMDKWNKQLSESLSPLRTADICDMIVETDSRYIDKDYETLEQAVCSLKDGVFTLATEDEWEYLCNGGTRTLFRWGDTLNDDILSEIYSIGTASQNNKISSVLKSPNMLGLFIAYDSYKNEIIDNTLYTKGGDGGCSLCGGDGPIYVLPCYTAFYRQPTDKNNMDISKDYYSYRRIIRLP